MKDLPGQFLLFQEACPGLAIVLLGLFKGGVIFGLCWLGAAGMAQSALARSRIWRAAILVFAAVFLLQFFPVSFPSYRAGFRVETVRPDSRPIQENKIIPAVSAGAGHSTFENLQKLGASGTPVGLAAPVSDGWKKVDRLIPWFWGGGFGTVLLFQLVRGLAGYCWLRRSSLPAEESVTGLWKEIAARLNSRRSCPVYLCRELHSPLLAGRIRAAIYLPEESLAWTEEKLRSVLLHEGEHWRRRDGHWQDFALLLCALWWWNPFAWRVLRRLKIEAEQVADDAVVLAMDDAGRYANTLIEIASAPSSGLNVGVAMIGRSPLEARIRAVLQKNPQRGKMGAPAGLVLTLCLAISLAMGTFYVAAKENLLPEGLKIEGRVVDLQGRPVKGAEIRIRSLNGRNLVAEENDSGDAMDHLFKFTAFSDEKGNFVIEGGKPGLLCNLVAEGGGYGPGFVEEVEFGKKTEIKLARLETPRSQARILGRVVDEKGQAVAGASVKPDAYHIWSTTTNDPGTALPQATGDSEGNFSFPAIAPYNFPGESPHQGQHVQGAGFLVTAPGFAPKYFSPVPWDDHRRDFVLEKGATVSGRLSKGGKALPGIVVAIAKKSEGMEGDLGEVTAVTDAAGFFKLEHVATGQEYLVYAKRDSLKLAGVPESKSLKVGAAGEYSAGNLEVKPGKILEGEIRFGDGRVPPLAMPVQLHVFRPGNPDRQYLDLEKDLKFRLMAKEKETIELRAYVPGYNLAAPGNVQVVKVSSDGGKIIMRYLPTAQAEKKNMARVHPVPPPGVKLDRVFLETPISGKKALEWKGGEGGGVIEAKPEEPHLIRLVGRDSSGKFYFSPAVILEKEDLTLELLPALTVKGKADASVPRPLRNGYVSARIIAESPDSLAEPNCLSWNGVAPIREDGSFELKHIPPFRETDPAANRQLELVALCDGYTSKDSRTPNMEYGLGSEAFDLGKTPSLIIEMQPTGRAVVQVLDPEGRDLAGAKVSFLPLERFSGMWTSLGAGFNSHRIFRGHSDFTRQRLVWEKISDERGQVVMDGLPAGVIPFEVRHPDFDMPVRLRPPGASTKYSQDAVVGVKAGGESPVKVQMESKTAAISLEDSTSPDGKFFVQIERNMSHRGNPQAIVVREKEGGQVWGSCELPENRGREIDLVSPAEQPSVEWSSDGRFFVFTVKRESGLEGLIAQVNREKMSIGVCNLAMPYNPPATLLSYQFLNEKSLKIETRLANGKVVYNKTTVEADGRVVGGGEL